MLQSRSIAVAALMLGMAAGAAPQDAGERSRIEAEIRRLNDNFAAEEAACKQRFAVTSCTEDVRLRRRETLAPLREQMLALDDADRRRRASARLAGIHNKLQAQRPAAPEPPPPALQRPAPAPRAASAPLVVLRREAPGTARVEAAKQAASAAAAQRVAAAQRRQQQAEAEAARVRQRLGERQRRGRPPAPLPVPAPAR